MLCVFGYAATYGSDGQDGYLSEMGGIVGGGRGVDLWMRRSSVRW